MEKTIISAKNVAVEKTSEEDDTAVRAAVIFAWPEQRARTSKVRALFKLKGRITWGNNIFLMKWHMPT